MKRERVADVKVFLHLAMMEAWWDFFSLPFEPFIATTYYDTKNTKVAW